MHQSDLMALIGFVLMFIPIAFFWFCVYVFCEAIGLGADDKGNNHIVDEYYDEV